MSSSAFLLPKAGAAAAANQQSPVRGSPGAAKPSSPEPVSERRTFIRLPTVRDLTGLPTSTIYRYVKTGGFPKPHELGPRTVGWLQSEVERWLATRQPRALR